MPYDKYCNRDVSTPIEMSKLKEQVLKDLTEAQDLTDRLEILDSFEAAVERAHTAELAEHFSNQILFLVQPFLTTAIQGKLPVSRPVSRPRMARQPSA